eukprot:4724210-Pyramimonas_sp.AAC.1
MGAGAWLLLTCPGRSSFEGCVDDMSASKPHVVLHCVWLKCSAQSADNLNTNFCPYQSRLS